ncbi:hypothetical protein H257_12110 [Aphanomyces astaci]|uniref:Uncharacterized protein n=1 Tax=Aphanomyces astaci TaxID=112090 RepID=W4G222_APHAT|nr:hypothetical protein H257_12110 [Aphanomyces astaci]ETV73074.1 hypothetical protein H257_12110 [Aphanomyces astaci]|eukprot:XP_009837523.1 hypothetical protein H257_12110 [Aphanomyces astaci]
MTHSSDCCVASASAMDSLDSGRQRTSSSRRS